MSDKDVVRSNQINIPEVMAEVTAVFTRYEDALVNNDVDILVELFWSSPHTLRYGIAELLYGADQITAYRQASPSVNLARTIQKTVITTFGLDFATANIEFCRADSPTIGRQSQTWVRMPEGWRIVAAHVSNMPL